MSAMRVVPITALVSPRSMGDANVAIFYLRTLVGSTRPDDELRDWLQRVGQFGGGTERRNELMDELSEGLSDSFYRAVGDVAPEASVNAYRPLPIEVVLPPGRTGFPIRELQDSFRRWQCRQGRIWQGTLPENMPINPATNRPYGYEEFLSRERFVETCESGRARVLLDVLLGPNPGTRRPRVNITAPSASNWPGRNPRWVRQKPSERAGQEIIDLVRASGSPQGENALRDVIRNILEDEMNRPPPGDFTDLRLLPRGAAEIKESVDFVMTYLRRHAPKDARGVALLDQFGEAQLTNMLGRARSQQLHPSDFVHSILEARNIMSRSLELLGEERGLLSLWELDGVEGAIDLLIQGSRKEKGFLFELDLTSWFYELWRRGSGTYWGRRIENLILEIKIGGLSGPDFGLLLRGDDDILRLRIVQAKCYESYTSLNGFGGAYFEQFSKDLRRLWRHQKQLIDGGQATGTHVWHQGQPPNIEVIENGQARYYPVDPSYEFYADRARMEQYAHLERLAQDEPGPLDADAIAATVVRMQYADAQLTDFTGEVTRYLQPGMPDSQAARDWILERSGRTVDNLKPRTARDVLEEHMNLTPPRQGEPVPPRLLGVVNMRRQVAGGGASNVFESALLTPPITARELMAMRIGLDPKSGEIDYDLVARILGMDPPFELHHFMHQPAITVS